MDKNRMKNLNRRSFGYESDEGRNSDVHLKTMLTKLENNHRRLLGVTSALTEALENTVRGNTFELEETLNKCMGIYPELFTLNIKKPPKNNNFRMIYNTSVSEDTTDTGEKEKKIYPSFQIQSDTEQEPIKIEKNKKPPFTFDKETQQKFYSHTEEPCMYTGYENPGFTCTKTTPSESESLPTQSNIPPIYAEPSFEILVNPNECPLLADKIQSQTNNLSPYPSPSPDLKNESSCQLSGNESSVFISPVSEKEFNLNNICDNPTGNQTPVPTDCSYTVKHPESDTDYSTYQKDYTPNKQYGYQSMHEDSDNPDSKTINLHSDRSEQEKETVTQNSNNPYEIIFQQKGKQEEQNDNTELCIKIVPEESGMGDRRSYVTRSNSHAKYNENENPIETCIIIKKQFSPNYRGTSSYQVENTKEEVIFNGPTERISVTIAKLESLSTGLRVQSGVMRPLQGASSHQQGSHHSRVNDTLTSDYPTKIALMNSYNVNNNSPKLTDEAFEEIKNDFISIKNNLIQGTVKQRSLILQSLRLNLIHTLAKERSTLLESYIENDIFEIYGDIMLLDYLMPKEIINGWDLILQQTILKFLNTMSSMWKGRDYLTSNQKVINCLQTYFFDKFSMRVASEIICKDMLVATFHKLSTRQSQQISLINAGVSEKILFSILENRDSISAYRLQHSLGLLINLCVNDQGRATMEPMCMELLILLVTLLRSKEKKIVPYAARLLYILMASSKFHKEAQKMDIIKTINDAMKISNKRIQSQLVILKYAIEDSRAHNHLNDAEEEFLENIELEIDELEEEVEVGEPGVTIAQSESYKKYGVGTGLMFNEDTQSDLKFSFGNKDETKSTIKGSSTTLQTRSGRSYNTEMDEDNATIDDKSSANFETKSAISEMDKSKSSDDAKSKKDAKGKNKKSKKKRDKDTESMLSSNYVLLKEALDNIIDDQTNYNIIPEDIQKEGEDSKKLGKVMNFFKSDTKVAGPSTSPVPKKEKMGDQLSPLPDRRDPKSRPTSQKGEHVTERSRKHSMFSQDGNNDYDYCEDTKQIQVPVQHHNIFSDSRQSPYKGMFSDTNNPIKTPEIHLTTTTDTKTTLSGASSSKVNPK